MILRIKRAHLVLKTPIVVMRLLRFDVPNQRTDIGRTHGKQAVSTLPGEILHALLLHPDGRSCFDLGHNPGRRFRRRQTQRQVNVIGNASRSEALATQVSRRARKIRMQSVGKFVRDQRQTVFRAENDMHQIETQRLRHPGNYMSGLQPLFHSHEPNLGLRPRLVCCQTFGPHIPHPASRIRTSHHRT